MYHGGSTSDDVFQYDLTTAWDLDTASYASKSFDFSSQEGTPHGVTFKPDGTKMFMVGLDNDTVYQYSLSTAWDVSTASYDSVSFSVNSQATAPTGLAFKSDGTAFYVTCQDNDAIYQYTMTTAYDMSTASYASKSKSVSSESSVPRGIVFNSDGTEVYIGCGSNHDINEYSLSTAWDISTATYSTVSPTLTSQVTGLRHIFINDNGTKTYVLDGTGDNLYQYTTGTTSTATITYPESVKWSGATTPDAPAAGEKDVYVFVTTDGGTTYYAKQAGDAVA
jgi:6-phosphogluconolactonase (cycloisomerase 2 family)